ncbi:uncharacterized protein LOC126643984 [Myiozetetes cayanensis]|uniref:uncharacterized protein LOC126643984 n=1 Tax=Myiozetetes cayanensis TaxID=478635 RepID=UPI00215E9501|nr:uncharacterized protein LOC126643984 [Myiozetetes cayanensis]
MAGLGTKIPKTDRGRCASIFIPEELQELQLHQPRPPPARAPVQEEKVPCRDIGQIQPCSSGVPGGAQPRGEEPCSRHRAWRHHIPSLASAAPVLQVSTAGICSSSAGLDLSTGGCTNGADVVSLSSRTLLFSSSLQLQKPQGWERGGKKEEIKLMSRAGPACVQHRILHSRSSASAGSRREDEGDWYPLGRAGTLQASSSLALRSCSRAGRPHQPPPHLLLKKALQHEGPCGELQRVVPPWGCRDA